jgi:hypothetical protein
VISRDVDFWDRVATHPLVSPHIFMGKAPQTLAPLVTNPKARPYASENGGVIFLPVDALGFVVEMHTLYAPEGWGREVALNGKRFVDDVLKTASLIITHEQESHWRSRPPRSHGWASAGDFIDAGLSARLRLWTLTREAWVASPVGRKMQCQ